MNRIVGELRKLGAITWADQSLAIVDWERLQEIAEFDPTYLSGARSALTGAINSATEPSHLLHVAALIALNRRAPARRRLCVSTATGTEKG